MNNSEFLNYVIDHEVTKYRKKLNYNNGRYNLKNVINKVEKRLISSENFQIENYSEIRDETLKEYTSNSWRHYKSRKMRENNYLLHKETSAFDETCSFFKQKCIDELIKTTD